MRAGRRMVSRVRTEDDGAVTTLGERLRQLRLEAGLSQAELAGEDLSASYISLLESGRRTPTRETADLLAARLGCSTSKLLEGQPSERDEQVDVELAFARLAVEHGESGEARRRLEQLLGESGRLPRQIQEEGTYLLAVACDRSGDQAAAIHTLLPLFEEACEQQTHVLITTLGITITGLYWDTGDLDTAVQVGERAMRVAQDRGLGDTDEYYRLAATVMGGYLEQGNYVHARVQGEILLDEAISRGRRAGQAAVHWNLAYVASVEGRLRDSLASYEQALSRMGELDNSRDYARLRLYLAITLLWIDPPEVARAINFLERSADDLNDLGSRADLASWNSAMSAALLLQGDTQAAETYGRRALELADGAAEVRAEALQALGDVLTATGRDDEAAATRRLAVAALEEAPVKPVRALDWRELGERLAADDASAAIVAMQRALDAAGIRDRSRATRERVSEVRAAAPRTERS